MKKEKEIIVIPGKILKTNTMEVKAEKRLIAVTILKPKTTADKNQESKIHMDKGTKENNNTTKDQSFASNKRSPPSKNSPSLNQKSRFTSGLNL